MSLSLCTLWDVMKHFMTWQFVRAWDFLWEISNGAERVIVRTGGRTRDSAVTDEIAENAIPKLTYCRQQFAMIGLDDAIERIDRKLIAGLKRKHRLTFGELHTQILELHDDVHRELYKRRFVYVPSEAISVIDSHAGAWSQLSQAFPRAKDEAEDARDCYALGKGTACVFYSMRVAEHGLRTLAKRLHVTLTHKGHNQPIEYADWDKVITGIKNAIDVARSKPHGKRRADALSFYSDANDHCLYLKDIWRNEVSHARRRYNDAEALASMNRVQGFMELLAKAR